MDKTVLEHFLSSYNWWMGVSTIAVAVGILGEYVAHFVFEEEARRNRREMAVSILFGVLVLGGVVGEYIFGKKLTLVSEQLQQIADTEVAQANKDAATARKDAELARKNAEGFSLQIAQANEAAKDAEARAAEANLELARFKAPRTLSLAQQTAIAARLHSFGSQRIDVIIIGDSPEITEITNEIGFAMQRSGWIPNFVGKAISGPNVSGVLVGTHNGVDSNVVAASEALIAALNSAGIQTAHAVQQYDDNLPMALVGKWDRANVAPIRMIVSAKP
jgi:hypothetical protein